jgi:hypothetical protein
MPKLNVASMMLAACLLTLAAPLARAAGTQDFATAYAAATAAEKQAGALKHQWTTTETVLKDSKLANAQKHENRAIALAKKAEALAKASIEQAQQQKTAWRDAVIK